eukprot:TRINITY_DN7354_c0_g1_i2.p2 TRINITY_DN7354_c0_g1~~TRINITY_DN7354_c0_g1_i2.p2  ORF type:complete len:1276 (+),score=12.13 TRINITY_DN7354_c0_g1_i2:152-3979(+)
MQSAFWSAVTYNCQSLVASGRRADVIQLLGSNDIVAVQGTRLRDTEACLQYKQRSHLVFEWPAGTSKQKHTNHCTGLLTAIHCRRFRAQHVRRIWTPPTALAGRVGAVRLKAGTADICVVNLYMCVEPTTEDMRETSRKTWSFVHDIVNSLPRRCLPVLCSDTNGHIGLEPCEGGFVFTDDRSVGRADAESENFNGCMLRTFLQKQSMAAINSYATCGPTFFGGNRGHGRSATRVDFICLPSTMLEQVRKVEVWEHTGKKLQMGLQQGKYDHRPVRIVFEYQLSHKTPIVNKHMDKDRIMRAVQFGGPDRERFVAEIEANLQGEEMQQALLLRYPDRAWRYINELVLDVGRDVFGQQRTSKGKDRQEDTQHALLHRLDCRRRYREYAKQPLSERICRFLQADDVWAYAQTAQSSSIFLDRGFVLLLAKLRLSERDVRRKKRRDFRNWQKRTVEELRQAWQIRDFAVCWRLSRLLSGKNIGPKRRRFDAAIRFRPTAVECVAHYSEPGHLGGFCASLRDYEHDAEERCNNDDLLAETPQQYLSTKKYARKLLREVAWRLRRAKTRKGVPDFAAPGELWRMLFFPNHYEESTRKGVGLQTTELSTASFYEVMQGLFHTCIASRTAPLDWHLAHSTPIDKKNGKPGFSGLRQIWGFEPVSKAFFKSLFNKGNGDIYRPFQMGFSPGRRREEAVAQQLVVGWKLKKEGLGHVTRFLDMANMFPSLTHSKVNNALSKHCSNDETACTLLQEHLRQCTLRMPTADEHGKVYLQAGSGVGQGGGHCTQVFLLSFNPHVDLLQRLCHIRVPGSQIWAYDVVNHEGHDVSLSVYADDLSKKLLCSNAAELKDRVSEMDQQLGRAMAPLGAFQNRDKTENVPCFVGVGSGGKTRSLFEAWRTGCYDNCGRLLREARYLGSRYNMHLGTLDEQRKRLDATRLAWKCMGSFWHSAPVRIALVVFRCMVHGTALSGLVAFCLPKGFTDSIDRQLLRYGRVLLRGKACNKEGAHPVSVRNIEVWRFLRLAPTEIEMRIQRLGFYQELVRKRERHGPLLAVLFGFFTNEKFPQYENDGKWIPDNASPWLTQFMRDIEHVPDVFEDVGEYPRSIFDSDITSRFLDFDTNVLRASFLSVRIPPPGYRHEWHDVDSEVDTEDKPFVCGYDFADPELNCCTAAFRTAGQLVHHKVRAHGLVSVTRQLVICNQCPLCCAVFSSCEYAKRHTVNALLKGRCKARGSNTVLDTFPCDPVCPVCFEKFETIFDYYAHATAHFEEQGWDISSHSIGLLG